MARGARALMDTAEPAYAPRGQDDAAWVRSVVAAVRPALDAGEGVLGWLYDARDTTHVRLSHLTQLGVRATVLEAFEQVAAHPATMTGLMALYERTPAGSFSGSLGAHLDHHRPWHRNMVPTGVRDLVVVNVLDDSHRGLVVCAPRRARLELSPARAALLQRAAAHLAEAHRLRQRSVEGARAEAWLSPAGWGEHAEEHARSAQMRAELARAVRSLELARGRLRRTSPEEALELWRTMAAGHWTLVDEVERDGRRYVLARVNAPEPPTLTALSARERTVAELVALGHSNKHIAYELGVSLSSVATHLRRAKAKLQVTSSAALARLMLRNTGARPEDGGLD